MFTHKSMEIVRQHPPVILLLGPRGDDQVDQWLERSPYSTHEVADSFQALEQISDFTVRNRPDVVFLHVDCVADELMLMQSIVPADEAEVPILTFVTDGKSDDSIDKLAARLFQLIPHHSAM